MKSFLTGAGCRFSLALPIRLLAAEVSLEDVKKPFIEIYGAKKRFSE
jgi:hypothetical protein